MNRALEKLLTSWWFIAAVAGATAGCWIAAALVAK
jgi:hypothetical protein